MDVASFSSLPHHYHHPFPGPIFLFVKYERLSLDKNSNSCAKYYTKYIDMVIRI